MEAWRARRGEVNGQKNDPKERTSGEREGAGSGAPEGALEALPQTPPGGKPPETPAPFPWALIVQNGVNPSRVRKPRRSGAPLTDRLRSEEKSWDEGKGALWTGAKHALPRGEGRRAARA
jgi:hypothetical protein